MATKGRDSSRRGFLKQASLAIAAVQTGVTLPRTAAAAPPQSSSRKASGVASEPVAETTYGRVRGLTSPDGIRMFRGVPYGGNTTGRNRFMPPTKPTPWAGVRDAVEWGSKAPQVPGGGPEFTMILDRVNGMLGSPGEDCLVVNIWTPAVKDGRKRPVMFRIHGGGYTSNTGNNRIYAGHNSARRGDVVYVTVNHRLGCLGFLNLADLAVPDLPHSQGLGFRR